MKIDTVKRTASILILLLIFFFRPENLKSQICSDYKLVPDSVFVNSLTLFEVQQINGGITPPNLWICNWIDFEADGIHESTNTTSGHYLFTSGGSKPVLYEINEPFLGNTEVCTSYVFVNACIAPSLVAKANNLTDTALVCTGTQLQLSATPTAGQSCPGYWQYAWFNGNTYYDGTDFLSFGEVWNSSFQNVPFSDISSDRTFTVKIRCSSFPACRDSSKVFVGLKPTVQHPVFNIVPISSRCQNADTINISATAVNADSIFYSLDLPGVSAGNYINPLTGDLIFDPQYHGTATITATAYGCDGPKTTTHQIITYSLPVITPLSDTTLCADASVTLDLGPGSYQYSWSEGNSTSASVVIDTSLTNIGLGSNMIYVSISDNNCNIVDSADITFTICSFNNSPENTALQISIYPNPADKILFIVPSLLSDNSIEVEVYTPTGQLVVSEILNRNSCLPFPIRINNQGVYFIKCKVEGYKPVLNKIIIY